MLNSLLLSNECVLWTLIPLCGHNSLNRTQFFYGQRRFLPVLVHSRYGGWIWVGEDVKMVGVRGWLSLPIWAGFHIE